MEKSLCVFCSTNNVGCCRRSNNWGCPLCSAGILPAGDEASRFDEEAGCFLTRTPEAYATDGVRYFVVNGPKIFAKSQDCRVLGTSTTFVVEVTTPVSLVVWVTDFFFRGCAASSLMDQ